MDPITALGLAGNILAFIDFTGKLLANVIEFYKHGVDPNSALQLRAVLVSTRSLAPPKQRKHAPERGPQPEGMDIQQNADQKYQFMLDPDALDGCMKTFVAQSTMLAQGISPVRLETTPVQAIASKCEEMAQKLIQRLERGKKSPKGKIWTSLNQALQAIWHFKEIEAMHQEVQNLQQELVFHIVVSLREDFDFIIQRQTDQFDGLKNSITNHINELIHKNMVSTTAAEERETSRVVTEQHQKTRQDIIDAINHALATKNLGHLTPTDLSNLNTTAGNSGDDPILLGATNFSKQLLADERALVESLAYDVIMNREEDIAEAHKATFRWIFEEPKFEHLQWSNFSNWLLSTTDPLYWITGKAASGKSTLMKYLFSHDTTAQKLSLWAGSKKQLVIAAFFFWHLGQDIQKTQEGLLRSILYQVFHQHRELVVPLLLPEFKSTNRNGLSNDWKKDWKRDELFRVFHRVTQQDTIPLKFCFFIDGLDEYYGEDGAIVELIKETLGSTNHIKICASSRPHNEFRHGFKAAPSLVLSNLTFNDIKVYVSDRFTANEVVRNLQKRDQPRNLVDDISQEIVSRADGVFLWVKLVVLSLLKGLTNNDRWSDLQWRLRELPKDLQQLYSHMLHKIENALYREQAAKLLRTVYTANRPLSLLQVSLADMVLENPENVFKIGFLEKSRQEQNELCTDMEGRLASRCLGLIEAAPASSNSVSSNVRRPVQFMHKTVADYLETPEAQKQLEESLTGPFCPYAALMGSEILTLKHVATGLFPPRKPVELLADKWHEDAWRHIDNFLKYAAIAEIRNNEAQTRLVEALDEVASRLAKDMLQFEGKGKFPTDCHWSVRRRDSAFHAGDERSWTMLSLALEYGLYQYGQSVLSSTSSSRKSNGNAKRNSKLTPGQARLALMVEQEAHDRHAGVSPALKESVQTGLVLVSAKSWRLRWEGIGRKSDLRVAIGERFLKGQSDGLTYGNEVSEDDGSRERQLLTQTAFPKLSST